MRNRLGCLCVILFVWAAPAAAGEDAGGDSRDSNGAVAMMTRIEKAAAKRDAAAVLENFCDQGLTLAVPDVTHPDGAMFVTKKGLRETLAASIATSDRQLRFVDCKAGVFPWPPDVAYLLVTRALWRPGMKGLVDRHLMIAHHAGGRWRICASFPLFVKFRVVVAEVQPGGPAANAGVKKGDIIVRYAKLPVLHAQELLDLGKRIAKHPNFAGGDVPVEIRRGKDRLGVKLPAGEPGVKLTTRAEGEVDTITLSGKPAAAHPAAKVIADYYAAMRAGNAKALVAAYCPGGFTMFYPDTEAGQNKSTVVHPGNVEALAPAFIQAVGKAIKLDTIKVEGTDLIVRGTAAVAGCRATGQWADGRPFDAYDIWFLVQYKGKWGTVAFLSPALNVRLGLQR